MAILGGIVCMPFLNHSKVAIVCFALPRALLAWKTTEPGDQAISKLEQVTEPDIPAAWHVTVRTSLWATEGKQGHSRNLIRGAKTYSALIVPSYSACKDNKKSISVK